MPLSIFDLFKIGIGPSSSHTVGPMSAARRFLMELDARALLERVSRVRVDLFGSLALTGRGHATDAAILLGLSGETPDAVDPDEAPKIVALIRETGRLNLLRRVAIPFTEASDLVFNTKKRLPRHPNGMRFTAYDRLAEVIWDGVYYSIGGGFVIGDEDGQDAAGAGANISLPYPFRSAAELLETGRQRGLKIAQIAFENERAWRADQDIQSKLRQIWQTMRSCIERGCQGGGILPGGLKVRRRAHDLHRELLNRSEAKCNDPLAALDWVNLFALAVNEENAAGGRVVTAPTNGAAGIIPAVLAYYERFIADASEEGIFAFLLTAGCVGMLYKQNASISAADVGCQGEVGVACSMAAAGLAAALGGTNEQIENAAEIGMEHNLGLTCDPIGGLVQIPCIERNTMGAVKAINAARLALCGNGRHTVSLDQVIATMRQTGADMKDKYKETAKGGLAVNVIAC